MGPLIIVLIPSLFIGIPVCGYLNVTLWVLLPGAVAAAFIFMLYDSNQSRVSMAWGWYYKKELHLLLNDSLNEKIRKRSLQRLFIKFLMFKILEESPTAVVLYGIGYGARAFFENSAY